MIHSLLLLVAALIVSSLGCAGPSISFEPDSVDVTLPAPLDKVESAVIQVLTDGGYDVNHEDDHNLTTGFRQEIRGPWDWLLRSRFGTERSRLEVSVTQATEGSARLRLHVIYEGKDGIFTAWEESPTALPQSAENQLRLIKNKLQLL